MVAGTRGWEVSSREVVLGNVRKALNRCAGNRAAGLIPTTLAAPRLRIPLSDRNRYGDLFGENLKKLAGKCIFLKEPGEVVPVLAELLQGKTAVASMRRFWRTAALLDSRKCVRGLRIGMRFGGVRHSRCGDHERGLCVGGNRDAGDVVESARGAHDLVTSAGAHCCDSALAVAREFGRVAFGSAESG